MKFLLEMLKIVGLTLVTGLVILYFTRSNYVNCSALDAFLGEGSLNLYFDFSKKVFVAFLIWFLGLTTYFIIRKKKELNLLLYIPLLTVLSLHSLIINASTRLPEKNREIKQEVCSKSIDDGMMLRFTNLNKVEYDFINSKMKWLPMIPETTDRVDIKYFRDSFIGEYHLIIEMSLATGEVLDSMKYPKWILNEGLYRFEEYQD